ncbi:hypothetical protein HOY80DRAFT_1084196 [Tuber brumale]|nr:hypothetical protein HOY80DRAFT_1084196 [Tuber brumale]
MSPFNCNWSSFREENMNFHQWHWGGADFAFYNYANFGQASRPTILPSVGDFPGALGLPLQLTSHGMSDGIETNHSSFANLSSIYAGIAEDERPSNYPYWIQSTPPTQATKYGINQTGICLNPSCLEYPIRQEQQQASFQSWGFHPSLNTGNPPTEATEYAINQTGICFRLSPSYPQYPIGQEQQQASFQSRGFYPSLDTGNPPPSPLPPHCPPAALGGKLGNGANCSILGSHKCRICGIQCKRQADLYRHLKTARKHRAPQGPVCPELSCKYTARFTRVDNFRAHYKRLHEKSDDEADEFIQEWKNQGSP